jgi:hypothetical protein
MQSGSKRNEFKIHKVGQMPGDIPKEGKIKMREAKAKPFKIGFGPDYSQEMNQACIKSFKK